MTSFGIVIGVVLTVVVELNYTGDSRWKPLVGGAAFLAPLVLLLVVVRFSGFSRKSYLAELDEILARLKTSLEEEISDPQPLARAHRLRSVRKEYDTALRSAPDHPALPEICRLLDTAESVHVPGPAPGLIDLIRALKTQVARLFLGGRSPLDRAARLVCIVGFTLIVFGAAIVNWWFVLGGLVLAWGGYAVLLRPYSLITAVGGGFIMACVQLMAALVLSEAVKRLLNST